MVLIQRALQELQGQAAAAGKLVGEVRAPVARAPEQMSPEDTVKTLGPVTQQIHGVQAALGALVAKVGEIQRQSAAALQGGQPGPMVQRLDAIRQVVLAVVQRCNGAKQQVETVLAEARQTGAAGN